MDILDTFDTLDTLPNEIIIRFLSHLTIKEIFKLKLLNKNWHHFITQLMIDEKCLIMLPLDLFSLSWKQLTDLLETKFYFEDINPYISLSDDRCRASCVDTTNEPYKWMTTSLIPNIDNTQYFVEIEIIKLCCKYANTIKLAFGISDCLPQLQHNCPFGYLDPVLSDLQSTDTGNSYVYMANENFMCNKILRSIEKKEW